MRIYPHRQLTRFMATNDGSRRFKIPMHSHRNTKASPNNHWKSFRSSPAAQIASLNFPRVHKLENTDHLSTPAGAISHNQSRYRGLRIVCTDNMSGKREFKTNSCLHFMDISHTNPESIRCGDSQSVAMTEPVVCFFVNIHQTRSVHRPYHVRQVSGNRSQIH